MWSGLGRDVRRVWKHRGGVHQVTPHALARLDDLPPSCKLVWYVLDTTADPLTRAEIIEETRLYDTTADYALDRLVDEGLVEKERVVEDVVRPRYRCNI